jgi:phosphate transport system substrate-binding protein
VIDWSNWRRRALTPCRRFAVGSLTAVLVSAELATSGVALAQTVHLLETGSTLLYPLFNLWVAAFSKQHPDVQITTQGTGSGTGISEAVSGIAQIGASDAYMSNAQVKVDTGVLNIPLAISSQMINYNLPGLNNTHLNLSGPVLAGIYSGKIAYWDDPQLKKLNPGVSLPHQAIIPVHRTDGSGDTFIFTQYLSFSTPSWANGPGYGTTISWPPVQGGIGAEGNPGMVNATKNNPYSIAYIGISFENATSSAGLGIAALENRAGKFVLPTEQTVEAAVAATAPKTPKDERTSLIFAPGENSYPIINYEYAIVREQQPNPAVAKTLKSFFNWAISPQGGSAPPFMKAVNFVPLPPAIAAMSKDQIAMIR